MTEETKVKVHQKSREYLKKYPDGQVIICTSASRKQVDSRDYGERFLLKYNAWGFVNIAQEPDYFGLYISSPVSAVRYFGVVDEIIDPREGEHSVENFRDYEHYESGNKLIMLEEDSIIELDDEIPFEGNPVWGLRYVTLDKFIDAKSTKDLWKG